MELRPGILFDLGTLFFCSDYCLNRDAGILRPEATCDIDSLDEQGGK